MNQEMTGDNDQHQGRVSRPSLAMRLTMMLLGWVVLAGGDLSSWIIGAPTVLLATSLSVVLVSPTPFKGYPLALLRFLPFFFGHALSGGVDVARRAFAPSLPIDPGLISYPLRLPRRSSAAIFFVNVISLLPGTLCAEINGDVLRVHVVDRGSSFRHDLKELEGLVSEVFGEPLVETRVEEGG